MILSSTKFSLVYGERHRFPTASIAGESPRQKQTGYQHKHITGGHEERSVHSSAFISLKSRYGTTRTSEKKKVPKYSSGLFDSLSASPMANEVDGIKICKCCRGSFLLFSLLPKRPNMQRLSPLPGHISFSHHTFLHPPSIYPPRTQRTEIPDLLVNILDAMFIDANSWKSSLAAYGM
jgi:hypothetical protein